MIKLLSSLILLILIFFFSCKKSPSDENVITPPPPVLNNNAPGNFKIQIVSTSWDSAKVSWTQSIDPDNDSVRYKVYLNDSLWSSSHTGLQFTFRNLEEIKTYTVRVIAFDTKNKETTDTVSFTTNKHWLKFFKKIQYGVISGYSTQYTGNMIKCNNNKDYLITGYTEQLGSVDRRTIYFAIKIDSLGKEIWKKYYDITANGIDVKIRNGKDGYLIVGGKNLIKIDENGNLQWQKTTTYAVNGVCVNSTGEIYTVGQLLPIISGSADMTDGGVSKFDQNGNLIWLKRYSLTTWDDLNDITLVSDDELIVLGAVNTTNKNPVSTDFWVMKLDGNGNLIWNKSYTDYDAAFPKNIIKTKEGNYVFTGFSYGQPGVPYLWIQMIDPNGVSMWSYFDINNRTSGYSVAETNDNSLVVSGCYNHTYSGSFSLYKFTKTGSKIWEKLYQEIGTYIRNKTVIPTGDGGYFIASDKSKAYNNAGETDQIYIFKTDDKGNWD